MVHRIWEAYPEVKVHLEKVKELMKAEMPLLHPAVHEKIRQYMDAPGKYIRSGLCLMMANMVEGQISPAKRYFAAAIEVLHLATLIHDDVIDEADSRRGILAAHKQFSNRIAIYAGDYLLVYAGRLASKGLRQLGATEEDMDGVKEGVLERILVGELSQLMNQYNSQMTMKAYLKQIQGKTALLFGLACQVGAFTVGGDKKIHQEAFRAGQAIGMAFQLRDDLIDYRLTPDQSGKPAHQDLQNGIYTAPLLLALRTDKGLRDALQQLEKHPADPELAQLILERVCQTSALEETETLIVAYLNRMENHLFRMIQPEASQNLTELIQGVMGSYY